MVSQLLSTITGLFKKDFLFASMLPALLATAAVLSTLAVVVGVESVWAVAGEIEDLEKAAYTTVASLVLVVFAYLLHALRVPFRLFWSGQVSMLGLLWGPLRLGEAYQRWRYRRLTRRSDALPVWEPVLEELENRLDHASRQKPTPVPIPDDELKALHRSIRTMRRLDGVDSVRDRLDALVKAAARYGMSGALSEVRMHATDRLEAWTLAEKADRRQALFELDRGYGAPSAVAATDLGNVIASYERYSFSRYRIESDLFWPRLVEQLPDPLLARIDDRTALLDFSLTTATLALVYGLAAALFGPSLWDLPRQWLVIGLAAALVAYFFYRLGVTTASQLGHLVRSAFDLHRLDLLDGLGVPRPTDFRSELVLWQTLSKLVVYGSEQTGNRIDFKLKEESS